MTVRDLICTICAFFGIEPAFRSKAGDIATRINASALVAYYPDAHADPALITLVVEQGEFPPAPALYFISDLGSPPLRHFEDALEALFNDPQGGRGDFLPENVVIRTNAVSQALLALIEAEPELRLADPCKLTAAELLLRTFNPEAKTPKPHSFKHVVVEPLHPFIQPVIDVVGTAGIAWAHVRAIGSGLAEIARLSVRVADRELAPWKRALAENLEHLDATDLAERAAAAPEPAPPPDAEPDVEPADEPVHEVATFDPRFQAFQRIAEKAGAPHRFRISERAFAPGGNGRDISVTVSVLDSPVNVTITRRAPSDWAALGAVLHTLDVRLDRIASTVGDAGQLATRLATTLGMTDSECVDLTLTDSAAARAAHAQGFVRKLGAAIEEWAPGSLPRHWRTQILPQTVNAPAGEPGEGMAAAGGEALPRDTQPARWTPFRDITDLVPAFRDIAATVPVRGAMCTFLVADEGDDCLRHAGATWPLPAPGTIAIPDSDSVAYYMKDDRGGFDVRVKPGTVELYGAEPTADRPAVSESPAESADRERRDR